MRGLLHHEATGGEIEDTGPYWHNDFAFKCSNKLPLYCIQVGSGGAPNRYPALPAGAKTAFATEAPISGDFAATYAAEAGLPDGGETVHLAADSICASAAKSAARPGGFHAWISGRVSALDYFTTLGMVGPWYRPDGFALSRTRAQLVSTERIERQLNVNANCMFIDQSASIFTGTDQSGSTAANCHDYTLQTNDGGTLETYGGELEGPQLGIRRLLVQLSARDGDRGSVLLPGMTTYHLAFARDCRSSQNSEGRNAARHTA